MDIFQDIVIARFNYWIYVILMMVGLHAMIVKNNLIKKLIGMSIFQAAIILFFVSVGVKDGATIPIVSHHGHAEESAETWHSVDPGHPDEGAVHDHGHHEINPDRHANPLPHVLMLTAIVVGVATLGVGLAVSQKIYREYGTLEENELLEKLRSNDG
jgi:multicomponent Na+:H+ antiporter subunit C